MPLRFPWVLFALVLVVLVASCMPGRTPDETAVDSLVAVPVPGPAVRVSGVGLSTPESVLHDPEADVYFVSNVNGAPWERNGNGFISQLSPEGRVIQLKWVEGGRGGVSLDAPKGMAIVADTLFVADIRCVRKFHRVTGTPYRGLCWDATTSLNDLTATPRGDLFISQSGTEAGPGALFRLRNTADMPQTLTLADGSVLDGAHLGGPNGVLADRGGLLVVTLAAGEVFRVTRQGERLQLKGPSGRSLDGVVSLGSEGYLISSFEESAVLWLRHDGTLHPFLSGVEGPADIGFDTLRGRVLVPLFHADEVVLQDVHWTSSRLSELTEGL